MDKNYKLKKLYIDYCSHEASVYAVSHWHYSKIVPGGRLVRYGVWENGKFIGAIIYGCGVNPNIGSFLKLEMHEITELLRVALNNHQAPVSKIVAISMKLLKKDFPKIRALVSYADPEQNHKGKIYQAMNWYYIGDTKPAFKYSKNGKFFHQRTMVNRDLSTYKKVKTKPKYKYCYLFDKKLFKLIENSIKDYIA